MNANHRLAGTNAVRAHSSAEGQTLVEVLQYWAADQPDKPAYFYVADGKEESISYRELDQRARALAGALSSRCEPGTTALLLHPLGLEFVEAFFGCLYAGVIAVPMHPGRGKSASARLRPVVHDCGARLVLTTSSVAPSLAALLRDADAGELHVLETDRILASAAEDHCFEPAPAAPAFLQYTSGSTSQPKGTIVTHRNIMANQRMLSSVFQTDRSTVIASWLPIFHDMGLIGNVLQAAYLGATAVLISTLGFIKSPILWLRTIERYQATFSGAPNFAYDLCVAKTTPEERAALDLSSWQVAFNGAEPVRQRTLEEFCKAFAPAGFRRSAFVPTYGLAEATLVVSGNAGEGPRYFPADGRLLKAGSVASASSTTAAQVLVSNGRIDHGDQELVIVDPVSLQRCSGAEVGEIWISGSHVAQGYWQRDEATRETFHATLPGSSTRYLRTGDLGFVRGSALFVTGRIKDLMIFRGQNIYPQDLELTVELAFPQLRPGCTAAFTIGPEERAEIVVVAELERREVSTPELLAHVARQVQELHEVPLQRLVLVRRNTVPKTTSGKIQRQRCKAEYERGDYEVIDQWQNPAVRPEREAREEILAEQIVAHATDWIARQQRVAESSIDPALPLAALGLDSISKVALIHSIEERFALVVPEASFFCLEKIADLRQLAAIPAGGADRREPPRPLPARALQQGGAVVLPTFSAMSWESSND